MEKMNIYDPAGYDAQFFKKRRSKHKAAARYMKVLVDLLGPFSSVLDLGAGDGYCAHFLADLGAEAHMVEINDSVLPYAFKDVQCRIHDLRYPLDYGRTFDLVMCVEVAEHLPEYAADALCDNIARHVGRLLFFTSAPPGQIGGGHINLQPQLYWMEKFNARGLCYKRGKTKRLKRELARVLKAGSKHIGTNVQVWGR